MTCDLCQSMSGRFDMGKRCCMVRHIAGQPAHLRAKAYEGYQAQHGEAAMIELKTEVAAEYRRQLNHRSST